MPSEPDARTTGAVWCGVCGTVDGAHGLRSSEASYNLHTRAFRCPFCTLRLSGRSDLREAGPSSWRPIHRPTQDDLDDYWADMVRGCNDRDGALIPARLLNR